MPYSVAVAVSPVTGAGAASDRSVVTVAVAEGRETEPDWSTVVTA
jgi:hypothetical protein